VQISISTRHGHLSEASQEKIRGKVEKLSRIFERLTSIEITIDLSHEDTPSVDLRVSAEHKHDFVATDRGTSLMGSIDTAIHKMEQQIRKYKERIQKRRGPRIEEMEVETEIGSETEET
jgi:putative sigma-54 modulation protein